MKERERERRKRRDPRVRAVYVCTYVGLSMHAREHVPPCEPPVAALSLGILGLRPMSCRFRRFICFTCKAAWVAQYNKQAGR